MRVLLTEDIEIARKVACLVLGSMGCEIDMALNGQAAIDAVKQQQYDLVFMDLGLPDMRGEVVAQKIREIVGPTDAVKIVALTAHACQSLNFGTIFDAVLEKPLTKTNLIETLRKLDVALPHSA